MITKHRPYPLAWGYFAIAMIIGVVPVCMGTAGNTSSLLLILGLIGLLLLPSVEVSDDAVIVSWAFGLHKRVIPLHLITDVTCSLGSYTKFVCIYVSRGKVCQINLGTFKRHAILAKDIRSRLEILKK